MFSRWILAAYFFFLSLYSKRFAYLAISIRGFPLFISELTLLAVFFLRARRLRYVSLPRRVLLFLFAFAGWGLVRLAWSFAEGTANRSNLMETLQQSAIFYQSAWILVPLLFRIDDVRAFFSSALAGAAVAQFLGWVGFLLMGRYEAKNSFLIGFPVGNEMILPLFPFVFLLWNYPWALLGCFTYGQLWMTQFVIYMKRAWVFCCLVFGLPLLFFPPRARRRKFLLGFLLALVISGFSAWGGLLWVKDRPVPIVYHSIERESVAQRQKFSAFTRLLLQMVDKVYPFTEVLFTDVTAGQIIFKGDLKEGKDFAPTSFIAFRFHLWKQTWSSFKARPWIGQGFGGHIFETQLNGSPAAVEGKWISGPHNSFLSILARLGIVGASLFLGLVWACLGGLLKHFRHLTTLDWMILAAVGSAHFFAFFNVCLENPQSGIWYWFFLGAAALAALSKTPSYQRSPEDPK